MELITRMRMYMHDQKEKYAVKYIPEFYVGQKYLQNLKYMVISVPDGPEA